MRTSTTIAVLTASTVSGFAILPQNAKLSSTTALNGLFDGVKEAFSAPALARSEISSERETPIDRWMGWSVVSENQPQEAGAKVAADFIDSMDEKMYVGVELPKPMGIVFEENDAEFGGIFIQSLKEDGAAAANALLMSGDQLITVGTKDVSGMDFDQALGVILDSADEKTKLTLFRGTAKQFYGPTGPSKEWLVTFCEKGGVATSA